MRSIILLVALLVVATNAVSKCGDANKPIGKCPFKFHVCGELRHWKWQYHCTCTNTLNGHASSYQWTESGDGCGQHCGETYFTQYPADKALCFARESSFEGSAEQVKLDEDFVHSNYQYELSNLNFGLEHSARGEVCFDEENNMIESMGRCGGSAGACLNMACPMGCASYNVYCYCRAPLNTGNCTVMTMKEIEWYKNECGTHMKKNKNANDYLVIDPNSGF